MRVLMTGGGTGGHIYPAIAIADTIKMNMPDSQIEFVGVERGLEKKIVPAHSYKLHFIKITGFDRKNLLKNIPTAIYMLTSRIEARKLLKSFKPDIVIGTGGYVCWPLLREAAALGIPTAAHESNAIAGRAILSLEKHLDCIMLNFESAAKYLKEPDKAVKVGNPLRSDFGVITKEVARKTLGIPDDIKSVTVSCGGSQGAPALNLAVLDVMREYSCKHPEMLHYHATGARHYESFMKKFNELGLGEYKNIIVTDYINDMPTKMAASDLVIARAGAMTVSEISRSGKCCIFIPSPHVAEDHQYKNAKLLADADAGFVFRESELDSGVLAQKVEQILENDTLRHSVEENVKAFAVTDANKRIFELVCRLVEK
jgi:UDP-N-acetylglucosamine--N-acetylmuramyl-(pentapeptide) pyrophosphoryl-undecaprenol N-acetylglucosamine transferase